MQTHKLLIIFIFILIGGNQIYAQWVSQAPKWNRDLYDIAFIPNNQEGVLGGDTGSASITKDGFYWSARLLFSSRFTNVRVRKFSFPTPNKRYAILTGVNTEIFKVDSSSPTLDITWVKIATIPSKIGTSVFFPSADTGYISCQSSCGTSPCDFLIYKTTDGGFTWNDISIHNLPVTNPSANDLYFTNNDKGVAVGKFALILETLDGGSSWINIGPSYVPTSYQYTSIAISSNNTILVGGKSSNSGLLVLSYDGGVNWDTIQVSAPINDVLITSDGRMHAVGDQGTIYLSENNGISWALQPTPTNKRLRSITSDYNNNLYAVGDAGTLITTYVPSTSLDFTLSDSIICTDETVFITNNSQQLDGYKWFANDVLFSELSDPIYTPSDADTGFIEIKMVADSAGVIIDSVIKSIYVYTTPEASFVVENTAVINTSINATNVIWMNGNDTLPSTSDTIYLQPDSTYTIRLIASNNNICFDEAQNQIMIDSTFSNILNLKIDNSMHIYPNPSNGYFTLQSDRSLINTRLCIYNTLQQKLYDDIVKTNKTLYNFNLNRSPGIYYLMISNQERHTTYPIIIK